MKKRILIFSVTYYPFVGGAEIAWKEITDRIHDFEFDMVTPQFDRSLPKMERIGSINVYRVGIGNIFDKIIFPISGAVKGLLLNKKKRYALVIGVMYNHASLAATFLKMLRPKIPFLLNLQDGDTEDVIDRKTRGVKFITKLIYRKPDIITVLACFLKERALKNKSTKNIKIIPNGVNLSLFNSDPLTQERKDEIRKSLNLDNEDKIIIHTGRLNYKNSLDDLIKSLSYLEENYKLILIGSGEEKERLQLLTKKLSMEKRVTFIEYKPHNEMIEYLKFSDVLCRPSLQEGLGNSFLEAMATGIPIVATPVGGIPDFLFNGETGLFCEVRNPRSIAQKIKLITSEKALKNRIVNNAKKMIEEKYSWNLVAEKYDSLFNKLVNNE